MSSANVFFRESTEMWAGFRGIIRKNRALEECHDFYSFLAKFAGTETNPQHVVLILTLAQERVTGYPIDLVSHLEALLSDPKTVEEAKQHFASMVTDQAKRRSRK